MLERLGLPRFQMSKFGPEDYFANHSNDNVDGFSSDRVAIYAWHKEAAWKRKEYLSLCADLKRGTRKGHDDAKFFTLFEKQRNAEKTLQSEFPDGRFRLHNRVNHVLCALDAAKETCLRGDATLQSLFCPLRCDRAIPHGYECLLDVYDDIRGGSDFTRLPLQEMKRALHGIYESKGNGIHNGKSDLLKAWAAMWTSFKKALTMARRGDCCDEDEQQDDEDQSLASRYLLKSNKREREPVPGNADDSEDEAVLRHRLHLDARCVVSQDNEFQANIDDTTGDTVLTLPAPSGMSTPRTAPTSLHRDDTYDTRCDDTPAPDVDLHAMTNMLGPKSAPVLTTETSGLAAQNHPASYLSAQNLTAASPSEGTCQKQPTQGIAVELWRQVASTVTRCFS